MTTINNGGPAFPHKPERTTQAGVNGCVFVEPGDEPGMTLRDYFAAKAIAALLLADGTTDYRFRAMEAYHVADAMLKAREVS